MRRLYPDLFDPVVPNPWEGVALAKRQKKTKPMATREEVYAFARGAVDLGYPQAAAAAVI